MHQYMYTINTIIDSGIAFLVIKNIYRKSIVPLLFIYQYGIWLLLIIKNV